MVHAPVQHLGRERSPGSPPLQWAGEYREGKATTKTPPNGSRICVGGICTPHVYL